MAVVAEKALSIDEITDDEIQQNKPLIGKRPARVALAHACIWMVLTAYVVAAGILSSEKSGFAVVVLIYVFISLRLLAKHVCISKLVYNPIGNAFDATIGKVSGQLSPFMINSIIGGSLITVMLVLMFTTPVTASGNIPERIQSFVGLFVLIGILYATSNDRSSIKWYTVVVGLLLQYLIALFVLKTTLGVNIFKYLSFLITSFLGFSAAGIEFLFFGITTNDFFKNTFAIAVFPAIIFFCSFISIVYFVGGMQYIISKFAWLMVRLMDTSGAESVVAAASPFVGQGESALLVKPFVEYMTMSELHSTMTSGFATIAGSVLLAYVNFTGGSTEATSVLLTACVMSVPCSLLVSKLRYPETEESITKGKVAIPTNEEEDANFLHAAGNGAAVGVQLVLLIAGALLSIVALFAAANFIVGYLFYMLNITNWLSNDGTWINIQFLLSYVFYPIAVAIGIAPSEARKAAEFMAQKMVVNEFAAFADMHTYAFRNVTDDAGIYQPNGNFSPRTLKLMSFALCGFANFASIGIQIGTLGTMAPSRQKDLAALAVSAMITGTFSTWITAAFAGTLL